MKKISTFLIVLPILMLLLVACGNENVNKAVPAGLEIVNKYQTLFNQGDVVGVTSLFDERSYVSVKNRYEPETGELSDGSWNVYIDIDSWIQQQVKDNMQIALSDCSLATNLITCKITMDADNHEVEGVQEIVVIDNKIKVVRLTNDTLTR
jgi:hypothetical protein